MSKLHEAFKALPLGSIKAEGWLYNQLRIQADGLTGHLEEHWEDVGPNNGWIGGNGESWERGPYYVDGLLPLAYILGDEKLIAKANRWVEWSLASQQENGSFGPARIETVNNDVDKQHDWWHFMIMLKVMMQFEEATGDERIVPFLSKFFGYVRATIEEIPLRGWAESRGSEMLLCILWVYKKTGDNELLKLADIVAGQTLDWTDIFHDFPFWRKVEQWDWRTHVVNVAMGIKTPGILYELFGEEHQRDAVHRGIDSLMTYHGQAHGMFSGDEWLSGTHPSQGVELCAVVEYMYSMEQLTRIFGEGRFGDILEKVAFNALPATISKDWTSHQYDQQVNQMMCNVAPRNWSNGADANLFGLEPNFGCCTANMHQGWPKLVSHLWMTDASGGLAAVSYAPCHVKTYVAGGEAIEVRVSGEYPFRDSVAIELSLDRAATFGISLRVPEWCAEPSLLVNGERVVLEPVKGYAKIEREWNSGDKLLLQLPMEVRTVSRNLYAISVERGPLVYALSIAENWQLLRERERFHDWEVYPASAWKYGLLADTDFEVTVSSEAIPYQPFEASAAPVRLKARGKLVSDWRMEGNNAGTPPLNPNTEGQPTKELELVPYGSAKLRIGEFPLLGQRKPVARHP
ncbi:beta-L-arabinofuranosidase domain-containing protein [Paenibacillus sp. LHD-38]|uniref:beta-L-arabinofuranosidase domain-containing protein n=1 Tax=Paenibacillus sp. LHD-38 TaxID=3072143 RepID=UPI00280F89F7|nr:beta-L-arabinofuranosidase domain-containing protein [Paenibacillus sp. LHD-38]MDQ8737656.1 glycoside hydrolase family 127 protein [Paenibacillus sp. LHD-38]